MDELSALRLIFRGALAHSDGRITIRSQMAVYAVRADTMEVVDPTHEYADVYDYIARDGRHRAGSAAEAVEVPAADPEAARITAEQFHDWQRRTARAARAADGPSGREIWLLGAGHAENE